MSKGWFGVLLNISLSAFTIATIALILLSGSDWQWDLAATVDIVAVAALFVLVLIQAPYRGQLEETRRIQAAFEKEEAAHKETLSKSGFLTKLYESQISEPKRYIWAVLRPVTLQGVGTQEGDVDFLGIELAIVSSLVAELPFRRMLGQVYIGVHPFPWIEFMNTYKSIPSQGVWEGSQRLSFTETQLRQVEQLKAAHAQVRLDLYIELQDGNDIHISQIRPSDPKNGA